MRGDLEAAAHARDGDAVNVPRTIGIRILVSHSLKWHIYVVVLRHLYRSTNFFRDIRFC